MAPGLGPDPSAGALFPDATVNAERQRDGINPMVKSYMSKNARKMMEMMNKSRFFL